jgi:hypothetical protein
MKCRLTSPHDSFCKSTKCQVCKPEPLKVTDLPTITQDELLERIKSRLESRLNTPSYSHFSLAPAPTELAAMC